MSENANVLKKLIKKIKKIHNIFVDLHNDDPSNLPTDILKTLVQMMEKNLVFINEFAQFHKKIEAQKSADKNEIEQLRNELQNCKSKFGQHQGNVDEILGAETPASDLHFRKSEEEETVKEIEPRNATSMQEKNQSQEQFQINLKELHEKSKDSDSEIHLTAIKAVVDFLMSGKIKLNDFIEHGFLPVFVDSLKSERLVIQLEAVRGCHCITRGTKDHQNALIEAGALPPLLTLLESSYPDIKKHALHNFSNFVSHFELREKCVEAGFLEPLIKIAYDDETHSAEVAFIILAFCQSKSRPLSTEVVKRFLPILQKFLLQSDIQVLKETSRAICDLATNRVENIPLIKEYKLLESIVGFISNSEEEKLQKQGLFKIFCMTRDSPELLRAVVSAGVIPPLIHLLETSHSGEFKELSLVILGNIAVEESERDKCIEGGLIPTLHKLLHQDDLPKTQLNLLLRMYKNLCTSGSHPILKEIIIDFIPAIKKFIEHNDENILENALKIFLLITSRKDYEIDQFLIDNEVFEQLFPLLKHSTSPIPHLTIFTINNIIFGTPAQVQYILDLGYMKYMEEMLTHQDESVQTCACFFLRKIIWKPHSKIRDIINANILPYVLKLFEHSNKLVQKEAIWVISCFAVEAESAHMNRLMKDEEFIPNFCSFLNSAELHTVNLVLSGLNAILRKSNRKSEICYKMRECGAVENIRKYSSSSDPNVSRLVNTILNINFS